MTDKVGASRASTAGLTGSAILSPKARDLTTMPLPRGTTLIAPAVVASRMRSFRAKEPDVRVLIEHLIASGFRARRGKAGYFGARELLQTAPGESSAITVYAQEYVRPDAADRAVVMRATLAIGERKETVTLGAVAPQGDFRAANGFESANGAGVVFPRPKNLWLCTWATFVSDCGPAHSEAVATGGISNIRTCAGCFLRSIACCVCNCQEWCKWLAGCCKCR